MKLEGKTVLITGAARGIGQAIASRLAKHGANLVLADINTNGLSAVKDMLGSSEQNVLLLTADVSQRVQVDELVTQTLDRFGAIDIAFSNAGIIEVQNFLEADEDTFDHIMAVNAKSVFLCGQAVAKHMVARGGGGRIINTASLAARMGIADMAAYCASKAAVMSLTRSMALALAQHRINVNALAPGIVDTDMWAKIDVTRAALSGEKEGEPYRQRISTIPLGRAATPEDVADVAEFLAGPGASYITGQTFNIDGGALPS